MATNPWDVTQQTQTFKADNPWDQPQSSLINPGAVPQGTAAQFGTSPELQEMLSGKGFSGKTMANMRATAMEAPANAGLQEMAQVKRQLGAAGFGANNPIAAGYKANVARETGRAQTAALRDVDTQDAQLQEQQKQFGIGEQTQIGANNMQAANAMALNNANRMFQALQSNQMARYGTTAQLGAMQ